MMAPRGKQCTRCSSRPTRGASAIAVKELAAALRAVEKRGRQFDGAALLLHADGSGMITAGDDERAIFEFDYPRHLAQWITATDRERLEIERARAKQIAERERGNRDEWDDFEASLGKGATQ